MVQTAYANLIASIAGGAEREQSYWNDFLLDASSSYDPTPFNSSSVLNFRWNCTMGTNETCGIELDEEPTVEIAAYQLSPNVCIF